MKQRLIELASQLKFRHGEKAYVWGTKTRLNRCETCGNITSSSQVPGIKCVTVIGAELRVMETNFTEVWYEVRHADRCTQQFRAGEVFEDKESARAWKKENNK